MRLTEAIDRIELCATLDDLRRTMHAVVQDYGFDSFGFVSVGAPGDVSPYWMATSHPGWASDYLSNDFLEADPVVRRVRRGNVPFTWGDVALPARLGKRKPAAQKVMDAARDHGLTEGLVVPFHFVDRFGRPQTASAVMYWKDRPSAFARIPAQVRSELHILMIYFIQAAMDMRARMLPQPARPQEPEAAKARLTDREREVLEWAGRGKTVGDTADILKISDETVQTHINNAMRKLDAVNKTHAVTNAIRAGLIDF